jgi:hypothetical protein
MQILCTLVISADAGETENSIRTKYGTMVIEQNNHVVFDVILT